MHRATMPRVADFGSFTEPAILILTSLARGPAHGYAIVKDIEELAGVHLGPGTLYAAIARLEGRGLVEALEPQDRRRPYRITGAGEELLRDRLRTLQRVTRAGLDRLEPT
jgi:DNA-binding PadR family transcriptional regulator